MSNCVHLQRADETCFSKVFHWFHAPCSAHHQASGRNSIRLYYPGHFQHTNIWQCLDVHPRQDDARYEPALECWVANTALDVALKRETEGLQNPVQASDENLIAGVHLYADNCAICHGSSDGKPSNLAQGFYIDAPQLAKDGVEDDPEAVSFWKIKHGIRFTAMPSFTTTLKDNEIWKIAIFLKQMDKLPPAVDAEWKKSTQCCCHAVGTVGG